MEHPNFLKEELTDAIKNYTYGLAEEGVILSETKETALFKVFLLERVEISIELSTRGFTIVQVKRFGKEVSSEQKKTHIGETFETMDALLLSVSPAFARKQSEELLRKLSV